MATRPPQPARVRSQPADRSSDFERDTQDLANLPEERAHLVGHSYGAVVALLMAGARPDKVQSLTVLEPPVRHLARGVPEVERAISKHMQLLASDEPEVVYRGMLRGIGAPEPRRPLNEIERRHVLLLMGERLPWEADLPLATIRDAGIPTLVATGGHDPIYELLGDRLADRLHPTAQRAVIRGAGHSVQRAPAANETFEEFWRAATSGR